MVRVRLALGVLALSSLVALMVATPSSGSSGGPIAFGVPSVADPIHTFGEPDIGIDSQSRVFVSGPTGRGTQRSAWEASVEGGQAVRVGPPGAPPPSMQPIVEPSAAL